MTSPVVFFDAGHTLVYPARRVGEVYAEVAEHFGVRPDPDVLETGFRQAWKENKNRDGGHRPGSKAWWFDVVRESWGESNLPDSFPFYDYFEEVFQAFAHPRLWRVYADVWGALERLQGAGVRMGVLSNWDHRLYPILRGHELNLFFSATVISEEIGYAKPDVEMFHAAEKSSGQNEGMILVGDDPDLDGEGARRAGWQFMRVERPKTDLTDISEQILRLTQVD